MELDYFSQGDPEPIRRALSRQIMKGSLTNAGAPPLSFSMDVKVGGTPHENKLLVSNVDKAIQRALDLPKIPPNHMTRDISKSRLSGPRGSFGGI